MAHTGLDLANPKGNEKNHGFTPEERAGFDNLVKAGFIDTFREFEKGGGHHLVDSDGQLPQAQHRMAHRLILISPALRPRLKGAFIFKKDIMGSDHCPVGIELK